MAVLDAFLLQVVATVMSALTVALLTWTVSILQDMRDTTEQNESRSVRNAKALRQSGIPRPPAEGDIPPEYRANRSETNSGSD